MQGPEENRVRPEEYGHAPGGDRPRGRKFTGSVDTRSPYCAPPVDRNSKRKHVHDVQSVQQWDIAWRRRLAIAGKVGVEHPQREKGDERLGSGPSIRCGGTNEPPA